MKLGKIIVAFKTLGEAKVSTLEDSEVLKVVKNRKAMRSHVNDYDEFLKDLQEKFKPENWDEIQNKAQQWNELDKDEQDRLNKQFEDYNNKISEGVKPELNKDINIEIEKLSDETVSKIVKENKWELRQIENIEDLY